VKLKEIETLIKYRLEQAQAALDDAKYLRKMAQSF
jgi:hypothetical protein